MADTPQKTAEWLRACGLEKYTRLFAENDIGPDIIGEISDAELKELGVSLGDRKRLRSALRNPPAATESNGNQLGEEPERRHLTVMFCDLVGSTALSERYDPEDLSDIVRAYQDTCAGIVSRYEGYIAQYLGDGILVYFGYPRAHEDDAERALHTGLEIIKRISELEPRPELTLSTRIGIATGVVLVGKITGKASTKDQVVLGETPNLAARLQSLAEPNQVVIAEDTRRLCGDIFRYQSLGENSLKGFSEPIVAHVVTGESTMQNRFAARSAQHMLPIVGREQEIWLLLERWRQAKSGEGQLVVLTGEAGIGKSRITRALLDMITDEDYYRINYQCSPYHGDSTLYPAIQQLSFAAQFSVHTTPEARFESLEAVFKLAGEITDEHAALLATLVGLDGESRYGTLDLTPQQKRARTMQALRSQLLGLATRKPVLVLLEDAHWIDPTTLEHLELVLDTIGDQPILILATARPAFHHNFGGHPIVTQLTLNRLGKDHVNAIVNRLTNNKRLPDTLLDEIVAKTDGVPLFVEELTKTILESGLLRETENSFELRESFSSLSIPISLHDSLMARLDRLQPIKEVAQTAACIGREFSYTLLAAVSPLPERELQLSLDKLIEAELIYKRSLDGDPTYQFKHALVRDAAYESLLKSKRKHIHHSLLNALEHTGTAPAELVAHHATCAELNEKAIDYWQQAGEQANARPAYREAIGHLSHAIHLTLEMGSDRLWRERELKLQIALGQAMIASYGYGAQPTVDTFQRALWLVETLGDTPLRMPALFGEWVASYVRGLPNTEHVERFVQVAEESSDSGPKIVAQRLLGLDQLHKGHFADALPFIEKSLALYDPDEHKSLAREFGHDQRTAALNYKCWALWHLGFPDQARDVGRESADWAVSLDHANSIGLGRCWGVLLANVLQRDTATVAKESAELIQFSNEMATPLWGAWSRVFFGWAIAVGQNDPEGLVEIGKGLTEAEDIGAALLMPLLHCLAAESYVAMGKLDDAEESMRSALRAQTRSEDVAWAAQLHIVRATIALHKQPQQVDRAEQEFQLAIDVAREQKAIMLELRAATKLSQLGLTHGNEQSARETLVPLYKTFTEGFESVDLAAAKAVLDQIQ